MGFYPAYSVKAVDSREWPIYYTTSTENNFEKKNERLLFVYLFQLKFLYFSLVHCCILQLKTQWLRPLSILDETSTS